MPCNPFLARIPYNILVKLRIHIEINLFKIYNVLVSSFENNGGGDGGGGGFKGGGV